MVFYYFSTTLDPPFQYSLFREVTHGDIPKYKDLAGGKNESFYVRCARLTLVARYIDKYGPPASNLYTVVL